MENLEIIKRKAVQIFNEEDYNKKKSSTNF